jgi:hypothetical protein
MTGFLNFLNTNSGAFTVIFTLVVAAATVFYAILTRQLVGETMRMRTAQTDPHVAVRIEPSDLWINLVLLVVENVGAGPAYDVRLSVAPDFVTANKQSLSELGMLKHGLPYMAPGQRVSHFLASVTDDMPDFDKDEKRYNFTVTTRYKSVTGTQHEFQYPIDFKQLIGLSTIGEPPLREIGKQLEKLAKSLSSMEGGWKRMKIDVYSARDRAEERRQYIERRERSLAEKEASEQKASAAVAPGSGASLMSTESPPSQDE